jgi:hypothetical protein
MPKAVAPVLLGHHGLIAVGQDVPASFVNDRGETEKTDSDHLAEIGVIKKAPVEDTPAPRRRGRNAAAEDAADSAEEPGEPGAAGE